MQTLEFLSSLQRIKLKNKCLTMIDDLKNAMWLAYGTVEKKEYSRPDQQGK
jgi:hypothetical protein